MGRRPHLTGADRRDGNVAGYTLWIDICGMNGGTTSGTIDEVGMSAVEGLVNIYDVT